MLALLILLTSTCLAAYQPDPERWISLGKVGDFEEEYLDILTPQYSQDFTSVDFWICRVYLNENKHSLTNFRIDKPNRTIAVIHVTNYESSTGKVLNSIDVPSFLQNPAKIVPGSNGEFYYELLWDIIPNIVSKHYQENPQQ